MKLHGLHTFPLVSIGWSTRIQVIGDIADLLAHDGGHYGAINVRQRIGRLGGTRLVVGVASRSA